MIQIVTLVTIETVTCIEIGSTVINFRTGAFFVQIIIIGKRSISTTMTFNQIVSILASLTVFFIKVVNAVAHCLVGNTLVDGSYFHRIWVKKTILLSIIWWKLTNSTRFPKPTIFIRNVFTNTINQVIIIIAKDANWFFTWKIVLITVVDFGETFVSSSINDEALFASETLKILLRRVKTILNCVFIAYLFFEV